MLVVFSSPATNSITMFQDAAVQLLRLMGATGKIPGAFTAADVPAALAKLEAGLARVRAEGASPSAETRSSSLESREKEDERDREPPVAIVTRAVPLIELMKRAVAANAALVWEPRR